MYHYALCAPWVAAGGWLIRWCSLMAGLDWGLVVVVMMMDWLLGGGDAWQGGVRSRGLHSGSYY